MTTPASAGGYSPTKRRGTSESDPSNYNLPAFCRRRKKISKCLHSLEEQPNLHQRNHVPILILPRILNAPPNLLLRSGWTYAAERACLRRQPGLTRVISSESCIPLPGYFPLAHFWRSIFGPTARRW